MGCKNSSIVPPEPTQLQEKQENSVKQKILTAVKRDDPLLIQKLITNFNLSYQEKVQDGFDTNWTILHLCCAKNSPRIIEYLLRDYLKTSNPSFDLVNARDLSSKTPIMVAYDYSSLEAFEALLILSSRFNHPVVIDKLFEKKISKGSEFDQLLNNYKYGEITSKENKKMMNQTKGDDKYDLVVNKGNLDNIYKMKDKTNKSETDFKDKEFSRNSKSVFSNAPNESFSSAKSSAFQVKWQSAETFFGTDKPFTLYSNLNFSVEECSNAINPNLVYIYCLISVYPSLLNQIFIDPQNNPKGIFFLTLYKNGIPQNLYLDDWFPFFKKKDELMFQKPFDNEIWPMLIEKALAKLYSSYSNLTNFTLPELMETIFGAPVITLEFSESMKDIFWIKLQDFEKKNYLILTKLKGDKRYLIIEYIAEVGSKKIIKVKKATREISLTKNLSDILFEEETKKIIGYENKDDGIYYYDLDGFVAEFESLLISTYSSSSVRSLLSIKKISDRLETFEFDIKKKSEVYLYFTQNDPEINEYSPIHFALVHRDKVGCQAVAEGSSRCENGSKTLFIDDKYKVNLEPGKYAVQVKILEKTKVPKEALIIGYSDQLLNFTSVSSKKVLNDILINLGSSNEIKEQCGESCVSSSGWWSCYYYLYFENQSEKKWEIEIKFDVLVNVKLGKAFKETNDKFKLTVKKGEKQVAYLQKIEVSKVTDFKMTSNHNFI